MQTKVRSAVALLRGEVAPMRSGPVADGKSGWWRAGMLRALAAVALLGGAAAGHAATFYEEGFSGTITSATGVLAPLCPAGNCNNVSGTMLIEQDLIPAQGTVYLNPYFYDFSAYDIDLPADDFFTLNVAGDITGYFGHHGSTATFVFTDGVFTGIEIDQYGRVPGTLQSYDLEMNGSTFLGTPIIGDPENPEPVELRGTINPGVTSVTPYYPGGMVPTPEPGSVVLLGSGALGLVEMMRRRWRRQ